MAETKDFDSSYRIERIVKNEPSSWKIYGVRWGNTRRDIELFNRLSPKGTQSDLARESVEGLRLHEGVYLSAPQIYGIVGALVGNLDELKYEPPEKQSAVREIIEFLKKACKYQVNTSTRAVYEPSGEGFFIHEYGLPSQYIVKVKDMGKGCRTVSHNLRAKDISSVVRDTLRKDQELLEKSSHPEFCKALFNTDNHINEIDEFLKVIRADRALGPVLCGLYDMPKEKTSRVVCFENFSATDRLEINCESFLDRRHYGLWGRVL